MINSTTKRNNSDDICVTDSKEARNASDGVEFSCVLFAYLAHLLPCKSRRTFKLSSGCHVAMVLYVGAKVKVLRVYTAWVIAVRALVQNIEAFWNWAIVKNPAGSMCKYRPSPFRFRYLSVASAICYRCNPEPATIGLVHLLKKAFRKICRQPLAREKFSIDIHVLRFTRFA